MPNDCNLACTDVINFLTDADLPANSGIGSPLTLIDGYRYINIFVKYAQKAFDEPPVDLTVIFALSQNDGLSSARYVNLEENLSSPQATNPIDVSGKDSWDGTTGRYIARLPVMGKYISVIAFNRAPFKRIASVAGYVVS